MDIKSSVILNFLVSVFSKELAVIFLAALPVFELRLALPIGVIEFNMSASKAYLLSFFGNILPVIPLLLFFKYFFHKLQKIRIIGKFFKWWFSRVEKKSEIVQKWGFWGLVLFVAIPLPITGAWTGAVAATLCEIRIKKAFLAIFIGVAVAGVIVSLITKGLSGLSF